MRELLSPLVGDPEVSMEIGGAAALALGLVFISSQDEECVGAALQVSPRPLQPNPPTWLSKHSAWPLPKA